MKKRYLIPIDPPTFYAVELLEGALFSTLPILTKEQALSITHALEYLGNTGTVVEEEIEAEVH